MQVFTSCSIHALTNKSHCLEALTSYKIQMGAISASPMYCYSLLRPDMTLYRAMNLCWNNTKLNATLPPGFSLKSSFFQRKQDFPSGKYEKAPDTSREDTRKYSSILSWSFLYSCSRNGGDHNYWRLSVAMGLVLPIAVVGSRIVGRWGKAA